MSECISAFLLRCQISWHLWRKAEKYESEEGPGENKQTRQWANNHLCVDHDKFFSWEEKKSRKLKFYLKKPRPTLTRSIHCLFKKSCSNIWFWFTSEAKQRKKSFNWSLFFQRFLAGKEKNKWSICDWNISFDLSIRDELPGFDEKKRSLRSGAGPKKRITIVDFSVKIVFWDLIV